jgi:hypothetical protein
MHAQAMRLYLQLRAALWASPTLVSRMQARDSAELYLKQNNQSLKIRYFGTIYSTKLARVCEREMKLWLFETFPYLYVHLPKS